MSAVCRWKRCAPPIRRRFNGSRGEARPRPAHFKHSEHGNRDAFLAPGGANIIVSTIAGGGPGDAPSAPTNVSAAVNDHTAALFCARATSATVYTVKRGVSYAGPFATGGTPAVPSSTDDSVTNGTTYYYLIAAANSEGEGGVSPMISATPNVPVAPAGASVHVVSAAKTDDGMWPGGQVRLAWDPVPGAESYEVQRFDNPWYPPGLFWYTPMGRPKDTNSVDGTLTGGTDYKYRVIAHNAFGSSTSAEVTASVPADLTTPPAPTGLVAVAGPGRVSLRWNPSELTPSWWPPQYNVKRSTAGGPYELLAQTSTADVVDTTAVTGVKYSYIVSANDGIEGPDSTPVSATPF